MDDEVIISTGEFSFLEREMSIQEEAQADGLASIDDELLTLVSMGPDQFCMTQD